jgi:hypothetical protein
MFKCHCIVVAPSLAEAERSWRIPFLEALSAFVYLIRGGSSFRSQAAGHP